MGCSQTTHVVTGSTRNADTDEKILADYFKKNNNLSSRETPRVGPALVRKDWSQVKQNTDPKNNIELFKLLPDLTSFLKDRNCDRELQDSFVYNIKATRPAERNEI